MASFKSTKLDNDVDEEILPTLNMAFFVATKSKRRNS